MRIDFHRRLNVFVGENGIGKTTILNALGKTIDIARLNHVIGNELKDLESLAIIKPHDIHMGAKNAHLKLRLLLRDKRINTTVGSKPEQLTSDKKLTDFILEAACREAEHVLCDRRYFMLDDELFKAFEAALKVPLTDNKAVQKLLAGKAQWED